MNRPEASYHLELVTPSYAFADLLHSLMRRFDFPAGITDRRDVYVVYLKEGDAVADFLGMMQAEKSVEKFEVARNLKEVRGQVNRLVNCETANLQKAVDAAGRQLLRRELFSVLKSLTPREERVIALRFGLEDGRARTLEELGKEFNVTRERVRQIEAKALRKLRHPSRAKRLRDYLDE